MNTLTHGMFHRPKCPNLGHNFNTYFETPRKMLKVDITLVIKYKVEVDHVYQ